MAIVRSRSRGSETKAISAFNPRGSVSCLLKAGNAGTRHEDESLALRTLCRGRAFRGKPRQEQLHLQRVARQANYDGVGKFSDYTMTAQSKTGVLLGFVISKDFDWGLVLADERRGFELGRPCPLLC